MIGSGYSGCGEGLNNPAMESDPGIGPIPRGNWTIGTVYDDPHLGPCVMHLDPVGDPPYGRTLFRMHGDNASMDHTASHGCIIMARSIREAVSASSDTDLVVE